MEAGQGIETTRSNWVFDEKVAPHFDDHVRKSVPDYDRIQDLAASFADWFLQDGGTVIDLGASTGETLLRIQSRNPQKNIKVIGYDNSRAMIQQAKAKGVDVHFCDLSLLTQISGQTSVSPRGEFFFCELDTGSYEPLPPPEPEVPATISGVVGWYDAQSFEDADGMAVTAWADRTEGSNTVAHNLTQYTGASGTPVAPTVQTVSLNGYRYRSIRFLSGATNEYEQLKVDNLVSSSSPAGTTWVLCAMPWSHSGTRGAMSMCRVQQRLYANLPLSQQPTPAGQSRHHLRLVCYIRASRRW